MFIIPQMNLRDEPSRMFDTLMPETASVVAEATLSLMLAIDSYASAVVYSGSSCIKNRFSWKQFYRSVCAFKMQASKNLRDNRSGSLKSLEILDGSLNFS